MLTTARSFLGTHVDNSPLILFRIIFGFLAAAESYGAILTGWVQKAFIDPKFTFTMIGFEWLQPLEGNGMIYYFLIMGTAALFIMLGFFYRASTFVFFSMWTMVYLMQKTHYNNHYYLLVLLSAAMIILPAHKSRSLDAKLGLTIPQNTCARICHWFFIIQIVIVYLYASIHKMHWDWLEARPIGIWFSHKANYWLIGPLLQEKWFQLVIAWGGVVYDGVIVFLLLHPKTRKIGFILSIIFNLFNSFVFQIGIFPYLMIGLTVFFFPPETIQSTFFKKKPKVYPVRKQLSKGWTYVLSAYFILQILLPLRHHLIKGDVAFTEEGHRLSWRMMLRVKSGSIRMYVEDIAAGKRERVRLSNYLTRDQQSSLMVQPDMIWQFAQRLKDEYAEKGQNVAVFANAKVSLNGHPSKPLIDENVDLAKVSWEPFRHSDWILIHEEND
ncbi:Vitamin K-dependent gamma-carboxylase [Ekhidna lutea]|uniref:Vitamin K-dependent gamma-carboxylase n=1 Tax=Ekhidna lutea TaxID=447679 RepID=A0A239KSM6_EKHLU|nr:HTTM domain-containing protein [Ekhidna lutea]SNT20678.1 Vitamin K-dependent gamma-carboxylase [Ekhidna lutea]